MSNVPQVSTELTTYVQCTCENVTGNEKSLSRGTNRTKSAAVPFLLPPSCLFKPYGQNTEKV